MKKILTILMFAAVFGLVMGSVTAADLQEHDFNGQFTLDVPGNYWMANAGADGHQYEDGNGIIIQYLTLSDINEGTFADYLKSQGLKDGKADGNFTVFQTDGKYVVVANSTDEMYIITDKNLDEAKAMAESADLEGNDATEDVINDDLAFRIGCDIRKLHDADIIHGDITTSNIMLRDDQLVFIDCGLGRHSPLEEDEAVDLLVLKKSLQSIDYNLAVKYFDLVLKGYGGEKMFDKISDIESRGRYTH